jgi:hypothetical protein
MIQRVITALVLSCGFISELLLCYIQTRAAWFSLTKINNLKVMKYVGERKSIGIKNPYKY